MEKARQAPIIDDDFIDAHVQKESAAVEAKNSLRLRDEGDG